MSEPQIKGGVFATSVKTVQRLLPSRFDAYLTALEPDTRAMIQSAPSASVWIPLRHHAHHLATAFDVVFDHDLEAMRRLGRASFLDNVKTMYRLFVRVLQPEAVLSRSGAIWSTLYAQNGTLGVREMRQGFASLLFEDSAIASAHWWHLQLGGVDAMSELVRLRDARARIVEHGGDSTRCVIHIEWSA